MTFRDLLEIMGLGNRSYAGEAGCFEVRARNYRSPTSPDVFFK